MMSGQERRTGLPGLHLSSREVFLAAGMANIGPYLGYFNPFLYGFIELVVISFVSSEPYSSTS